MRETIHLYHTNDLHSHFENWPKIVHFLNDRKELHKHKNEEMLLVDIGDHADRFHPITEATSGKANVDLLNSLQYHAVTIGNNEGITFSYDDLNSLYKQASFPVIVSNLYTKDGKRPSWVVPFHIITLKSGIKVALLGVTVFYEKFYELLGWKVEDPFQCILETVEQVKKEANIIILLSHLGLSDDELIARDIPEIDLIIGGHTHHVLQNGKVIENTLIAGAGKYGQYVGHIALHLEGGSIVNKQATVYSMLQQQDSCGETEAWLEKAHIESEKTLSEVVGVLQEDLTLDWFNESSFPLVLVQALREWCDGEVAMVNSGMLLESLKKGPVTKKDIHRICPHPINPCKVKLKGDVLKEVIVQARDEKMENLKLKGLGFRGKVMGRMVFEGINVKTEVLSDGKQHVTEITVHDHPIDYNRVYSVATVDMFALGPLYPEISHSDEKTFFMPELLRDLLAWKLGGNTA